MRFPSKVFLIFFLFFDLNVFYPQCANFFVVLVVDLSNICVTIYNCLKCQLNQKLLSTDWNKIYPQVLYCIHSLTYLTQSKDGAIKFEQRF